jgi:hypothetical protein
MLFDSSAARGFIEMELSTGHLFADFALDASEDARERYICNARKAYDTAARFLVRSRFDHDAQHGFEQRLAELEGKLRSLEDDSH